MTTLDDDACYRAMTARDARFDGQFFTGVTSTGIFCRPVCPARTPGRANCNFYPSAAAALEAGFRPCLRCRPEVSPDRPAWAGTSIVVGRALRLINEGALDDAGSVERLAARVGLGERHLRRLFEEHLGASPVAVAQARRLLFAKRLLTETRLPLTEVALAAGFGSLRRFNDLFLRTYSRSPRLLRKEGLEAAAAAGAIEFKLPYRPPYDWRGVSGFLGKRAIPGVEQCDAASGGAYSRTVMIGGRPARLHVEPIRDADALRLRLEVASVSELRQVVERVTRMFDLGAEPAVIQERLGKWGVAGVRIPGAWDPFELAVRAILGQQVSVAAAVTMAARIVERWGETAANLAGAPNRLFPAPDVLALADVASIGLPRARAETITGLARLVDSGALDLASLGSLDDAVRKLRSVRGIGEWTAQYIAMRAFSEPDAFPTGDLALRKAADATDEELRKMAEAWRPWRAYAAFSLWQRGNPK